jgi:hypothetical protein
MEQLQLSTKLANKTKNMGIRDLNKMLADRRLIHTAPISALKGARVGIDGFHWLKNNVTITPEPFQGTT